MREIKFRGKSKGTNEWVYGNLIISDDGNCYISKGREIFSEPVYEESVSQYTGRKDKDGKEVYEKDKVTTEHLSVGWSGKMGVIEWLPKSAKFVITNGKLGYNKETCGISNVVKVTGTIC